MARLPLVEADQASSTAIDRNLTYADLRAIPKTRSSRKMQHHRHTRHIGRPIGTAYNGISRPGAALMGIVSAHPR